MSALGPVRQVEAGVLDVGYVDAGPADDPAVLLLHGWPYDIHSYADVVRSMAERAGATITELEGSHVIMISQPQAVVDVILEAFSKVSQTT